MVASTSQNQTELTAAGHHRGRWTVNITPAERAARVVVGGFGATVGVVLLLSAGSLWAILGTVLLIAAGLDLVATGALGHCPLYAKLGYTPATLRGPH